MSRHLWPGEAVDHLARPITCGPLGGQQNDSQNIRSRFNFFAAAAHHVYFSTMVPRQKQPVVICPRCRRRMATKEHRPTGPKARKAIKFSDSLVEVAYVCESCGTEIKRTIREST
jgi:DNA-directed RNA polymerase subunit RPC12/RpoP